MSEERSASWRPATIAEVLDIVRSDSLGFDEEESAAYSRYRVEPYRAPMVRYAEAGTVVVVARRDDQVIYWDDFERGFNVSRISTEGQILEHWCNQDDLGRALNAWIDGREASGTFGPAVPISK